MDVEQIMREIRGAIAQRHGIDLSTAQIRELAARRLEAILQPGTMDRALLEQLRAAAGESAQLPAVPAAPPFTFEGTALFDAGNGVLRFVRRLLHPVLKLFFDPAPLTDALQAQARWDAEATAREVEQSRRQAEWNALHYQILQQLVLEVARTAVDTQQALARVESLTARLDFADRRLRMLDAAAVRPGGRREGGERPEMRPAGRGGEPRSTETAGPDVPADDRVGAAPAGDDGGTLPAGGPGAVSRRKRRRRPGRRTRMPGVIESTADGDDTAGAEFLAPPSEAMAQVDTAPASPSVHSHADTQPAAQPMPPRDEPVLTAEPLSHGNADPIDR